MAERIPTMKMVKGDNFLICNVSDKARFEAEGWKEPGKVAPKEEPKAVPQEELATEQPKPKKR